LSGLIEWVVEEFRTRYFDFTAKHFHETPLSLTAARRQARVR
jgi:hypothetical protein